MMERERDVSRRELRELMDCREVRWAGKGGSWHGRGVVCERKGSLLRRALVDQIRVGAGLKSEGEALVV